MLRSTLAIACILLPLLALQSCNSSGSAPVSPEDVEEFDWKDVTLKRWILVEMNGLPVASEQNVELEFDGRDRIAGNAGVNQIMGSYQHDSQHDLKIGTISSTMMAGSPEAMKLEQEFLEGLGEVDKARMENEQLLLMKANDVLMRFQGVH